MYGPSQFSTHCGKFLTEFVARFSRLFCHRVNLFNYLQDIVKILWSCAFLPAFHFMSAVLKTDIFCAAFSLISIPRDFPFQVHEIFFSQTLLMPHFRWRYKITFLFWDFSLATVPWLIHQ